MAELWGPCEARQVPQKDWLGLGVGVTVLDDTVDAAVVAKATPVLVLNPNAGLNRVYVFCSLCNTCVTTRLSILLALFLCYIRAMVLAKF